MGAVPGRCNFRVATLQLFNEARRFQIRNKVIWAKDRLALRQGNYHWQHEPCWYAVPENAHWNGDRSQTTLWSIKTREGDGYGMALKSQWNACVGLC